MPQANIMTKFMCHSTLVATWATGCFYSLWFRATTSTILGRSILCEETVVDYIRVISIEDNKFFYFQVKIKVGLWTATGANDKATQRLIPCHSTSYPISRI